MISGAGGPDKCIPLARVSHGDIPRQILSVARQSTHTFPPMSIRFNQGHFGRGPRVNHPRKMLVIPELPPKPSGVINLDVYPLPIAIYKHAWAARHQVCEIQKGRLCIDSNFPLRWVTKQIIRPPFYVLRIPKQFGGSWESSLSICGHMGIKMGGESGLSRDGTVSLGKITSQPTCDQGPRPICTSNLALSHFKCLHTILHPCQVRKGQVVPLSQGHFASYPKSLRTNESRGVTKSSPTEPRG